MPTSCQNFANHIQRVQMGHPVLIPQIDITGMLPHAINVLSLMMTLGLNISSFSLQRRAAVALEEGHFTKEIATVSVKGRKGAVTEVRSTKS